MEVVFRKVWIRNSTFQYSLINYQPGISRLRGENECTGYLKHWELATYNEKALKMQRALRALMQVLASTLHYISAIYWSRPWKRFRLVANVVESTLLSQDVVESRHFQMVYRASSQTWRSLEVICWLYFTFTVIKCLHMSTGDRCNGANDSLWRLQLLERTRQLGSFEWVLE